MCAFYDQRTTFYSHIGIHIFFAIWRQFLFGHPNRPVRPPEQSALFGFSEVPEPEPEQKNRPIGRYKTATEWPNRAIRRTDVQNSLFGSLFSLQNHSLTKLTDATLRWLCFFPARPSQAQRSSCAARGCGSHDLVRSLIATSLARDTITYYIYYYIYYVYIST